VKHVGHQRGVVRLAYATFVLASTLAAGANAQTLPAGWTVSSIGNPVISGSATHSSGTFSVSGAGTDIWGSSDQFTFVHRQLRGDATIVARVATLQNINPWSKAGVMIRSSLAANSRHASVFVTPLNGVAFQRRASTGGTSRHTSGGTGIVPVWLKLERRSGTLTAYRSANGTAWSTIGSATISMSSTVYVGLAVTSHDAARAATATFSNVTATVDTPGSLPAGWTAADIGAPPLTGSTQYAGGTYTIEGAGEVGPGATDQFRFVYRAVTGDVDIRARVISIERTHQWSKAGVMLRETLAANSVMGLAFISGASVSAFQRRVSTGASRQHTDGPAVTTPHWVRLVRRGTSLTASQSSDGATWMPISTMTVSQPSVYVGLAVASANSQLATGVFDNVVVETPSTNQSPTVSLTSPPNGATYTAPASIPLAANASDVDGTIARVDFYAGATLVGTVTSSPYTYTWNGVAAGSYSITAVARDNAGAMTVSGARDIRVDPAALPRTAIFTPSTNHASAVDRYFLEIFPAGADPLVANPVATRDLGKPPVVNGECTVDVSATTVALPPGSYIATVTAIGSGGSARSAPSPTFVR
jgi:regulation of enolase protein 1 (concanavalin A-like superfamily)